MMTFSLYDQTAQAFNLSKTSKVVVEESGLMAQQKVEAAHSTQSKVETLSTATTKKSKKIYSRLDQT